MNLDDLLKSIREEDDSKGGKIDGEKLLKRKSFENPLKGQNFTAPSIPGAGAGAKPLIKKVVLKIEPEKLIPPKETTEASSEFIEKINELIDVIKADNKLEKDAQTLDKREDERENRQKREKRIEVGKIFKGVTAGFGNAKKKIGGVFDTILKFAGLTLLGQIISAVTNFLADPKNEILITNVQNFFKSLPEKFESFKKEFQKLIDWFEKTKKDIEKFAEDFQKLLAATPFLGQYFATPQQKQQGLPAAPGLNLQPGGIPTPITGPLGFPMLIPFATGGFAMGTDTVPAMLTPGEFVMSRGAVSMFGSDTMMAMNKAGGGNNRPKYGMVSGYSEGGGVGKMPQKGSDFWTLVAVAGTEDSDPQAWADVAQSIYNRAASGVYAGGSDIRQLILTPDQYEPTWKHPRKKLERTPNPEWYNISDIQSASIATGKPVSYLQRVADAIQNKKLQDEARRFVGARTDFMGGNEKANFAKGDVRRGKQGEDNFFGSFVGPGSISYAATNPDPGTIPGFVGTMPSLPALPPSTTTDILAPVLPTEPTGSSGFDFRGIPELIFKNLRKIVPVYPLNPRSSNKFIVLPPIAQNEPSNSVVTSQKANDIPDFNISGNVKMRGLVGKALGIEDLV